MTNIEITIDGEPTILYIEKQRDYIDTEIIYYIIQKYKKRKIEKEQIEFIWYLNQKYDAWIKINENEKIKISNGLKILVKLKDETEDNDIQIIKKKIILDKIKNLNNRIDKEISKLNNKKKLLDVQPSTSFYLNNDNNSISNIEIPEKENPTINEDDIDNNLEVDITILTANPLIDIEDNLELKTMNDFNSIAYSINQVILDCNKQIRAQFLPLTRDNLEYAISQRPKIIHLICKSTYVLNKNINNDTDNNNNNNNNYYSPYLLFENENCEIERINQEELNMILNSKDLMKIDKEILKNITLFISTPLSEEVFEMFDKFNFKNIIVQHTTLADITFISELNEQLYRNIIDLNKPISVAFEDAKNDSKNLLYQVCCCFHKHKNNCQLKMNLSNELYFYRENKNEIIFEIPHFYHLCYICDCPKKGICNHHKNCDNYNYSFKPLCKKKLNNNICCCYDKKKHGLDNIFFCKFPEIKNEDGIFSNYQSNNFSTIINSDYVPNYDKMNLIIGRNFIVYNIFDSLISKCYNIINVHGKQYRESINKIDLLIDMIIEFLRERIPYLIFDDSQLNLNNEQSSDLSLSSKNTMNIKINKFNIIKEKICIFDLSKIANLDLLFPSESAPQIESKIKFIPVFEKIDDQNSNIRITNDNNNFGKKVFFINGFKITHDDLIKLFNEQNNIFKSQVILFTEDKFDKTNLKNANEINIVDLNFEALKKEDYEIILQNQKIIFNKDNFDKKINDIVNYSLNEKEDTLTRELTTIVKDNNQSNLIYEILFLFNCSNSGHYKMEMEALYPNNIEEINTLIEEKFIQKRIIIKENHKDYYYQYNRRIPIFNDYYDDRKNKIPDKVKQLLLEKLFCFYYMIFLRILKEVKSKGFSETENNIKIQFKPNYKPNDSLTSFSAIQELGIWLPFEVNQICEICELNNNFKISIFMDIVIIYYEILEIF